MNSIIYRIVPHDGGWAYQLGDSYSETYASHAAARAAAAVAAREQKVPGQTARIEYEDASGQWITERADGRDRPDTAVED